ASPRDAPTSLDLPPEGALRLGTGPDEVEAPRDDFRDDGEPVPFEDRLDRVAVVVPHPRQHDEDPPLVRNLAEEELRDDLVRAGVVEDGNRGEIHEGQRRTRKLAELGLDRLPDGPA